MKKIIVIAVLLLLASLMAVSFLVGFAIKGSIDNGRVAGSIFHGSSGDDSKSFGLLDDVIGIIDHTFVEDVTREQLEVGAVKGVLEALDDPYSHYFDAEQYDQFQDETEGQFSGVGLEIGAKDDTVVVVAPIKDTPAERAGILEGDVIAAVDAETTEGLSLDEVVKRIRGPKGTEVVLSVNRAQEEEPRNFTVVRDKISIPNATWEMLDDDIGYLRLHFFNKQATSGLSDGIKELKSMGAKGLVLDLRNNPGGILDEAISVAGLFLPRDQSVVIVKSRQGEPQTYRTRVGGDESIPLVVLVNEGSASASEIVAGALQDHNRAELVGKPTFGKASVQELVSLPNDGAIVITTAKYETPNGRSIYKEGVKPDSVVETKPGTMLTDGDAQLNKAKEILGRAISGLDIAA